MSSLPRLLGRVVNVRPDEASGAAMMFGYSCLTMTAYTIVEPIRDSQFITSLGADNLPLALLVAGVLVGLLMHAHSRSVARLPLRWIVPVTVGGKILLLLLFWLLFQTGAVWVSAAFYLFGLIFGVLLTSQFWTLANDLYDARQAKRLFAFIGSGASLGGLAGSAVATFATSLGTNNLLLISAAVLTVCLGLILGLTRRHSPVAGAAHGLAGSGPEAPGLPDPAPGRDGDDGPVGRPSPLALLRSSPHLQSIAAVTAMAAIGATIIGQQLNMAAEAFVGSSATDDLTAFLGRVNVFLSAAAFLVQVTLTSRLHQALGLGFALLVLPISFGATATVMLVSATLWAPGLARGLDGMLRYTVDRTTREILFLPLPPAMKHRAKPFVDVTVDRAAKAAAALLLLVLVKQFGFDWQQLSYASLAVTGVWIVLAVRARREYLMAFRQGLEAHTVEADDVQLDVADGRTLETLVEELSEPDEARVLNAIEMLETLGKRNLVTPLLLHHDSARVRTRALLALEAARPDVAVRWTPAIERMLLDDDPSVRAAAVRVLAVIRKEDARAVMRQYLRDPEPRVAATAAAVLADTGTEDDIEAAYATLQGLAGDTRVSATRARQEGAAALGRIRHGRFRALLVPLISDPDLAVTRAALQSARPLAREDALFLPTLIALLGHRELKPLARDVLASYGEHFLDALRYFLKDRGEDIWVRRHIPATLAAIPTQESLNILVDALDEPDGFLRFKVVTAIEKLRAGHPELVCAGEPFQALALRESSRYYDYLTLRHNLLGGDTTVTGSLLMHALDDKLGRSLDRLYRVIGLSYPDEDIAAARRTILRGDGRSRAGALEYIDNLLSPALRKRIMPILEALPLEEKVRHGYACLKTRPRDLDDTLAQLVHHSDAVVAAAAVHLVATLNRWALADDLDYVSRHAHPTPYAAEAARWALERRREEAHAVDAPLPVVELADRLRRMQLFEFVSVDELLRIADAGRQVRYDENRVLYHEGTQPSEVQFLLSGRVQLSAGGGGSSAAAPAALAFESILEGSPMRYTVRTLEPVTCLSLDSEQFLTMLSDNVLLAQGLFRMMFETRDVRRWRIASTSASAAAADQPRFGNGPIQPLEKAMRLRDHPLLARATIPQLLEVAAIAPVTSLSAQHVLFTEGDDPVAYYVLDGVIRLEADGVPPVEMGPGTTIGLAETLAGVPLGRRGCLLGDARLLRIDRASLFEVLADHVDLMQGIFSALLQAGEDDRPGPTAERGGEGFA